MNRRRRRRIREDRVNHDAWVIPYADLLTLLLALFVVLYAVSSVNEGKYRALSDALSTVFKGEPRSPRPIQTGAITPVVPRVTTDTSAPDTSAATDSAPEPSALAPIADDVARAMDDLVRADAVVVRRRPDRIEVEIRTDILYSSGSASLSPGAADIIRRLAVPLRRFPNPVRVEGHTDDRPIRNPEFRSNWELSSARAASVVHLLADSGVEPSRLSVVGKAEFSPARPNTTPEGRNANRRVLIVILPVASVKDATATGMDSAP